MGATLPLAIGIENYKEIIETPYYYVDKTLFLKDLIDKKGKACLFTRPRRFGKTLTLSMIQTFFEKEMDDSGQILDNSQYFAGKKIMDAGETYTSQMGKYPVIALSLKSAKQADFDTAYESLVEQIADEYKRHCYILQSNSMLEEDKVRYQKVMTGKGRYVDYALSLHFLSGCLKKYHKQNVIILLDEYDVPLENAWFRGFYQQMIDFIRSLFESALKTNNNLAFAVVTGCLHISRESIFTGLNNLKINSLLDVSYDEYFGFTETEVLSLLQNYHLEDRFEEVRKWYYGYLFGKTGVYNPWSVLNYAEQAISGIDAVPKPYWSNTSSNSIVRELIEKSDAQARSEIETLIAGGTIEKPVHEEITYGDIYNSQDNLWNFLFFTGYLKMTGQHFENNTNYLTLSIPNEEIRSIYRNTIREWFQQKIKGTDLSFLYGAIFNGDCKAVETVIKQLLRDSISFWDSQENFYHGFMLGLLSSLQDYTIKSNLETGESRCDLTLIPNDELQPAVLMEFKVCKKFSEMDSLKLKALEQIEEKHYAAELEEEGYEKIMKYGICFCKKSCRAVLSE